MDIQSLLNQLMGATGNTVSGGRSQKPTNTLSGFANVIPGGLAGGAAAGGIVSLLIGNKKARKFAGQAATYGGMAVVGGLAYAAFRNWQQNQQPTQAQPATDKDIATPHQEFLPTEGQASSLLELALIKSMIAAAKADGHIDAIEQEHIFKQVDAMNLPADHKALVFDCLRRDITPAELAQGVVSLEHKSEVYLASCLAINPDHPQERAYLDQLSSALALPQGLAQHLEAQARHGLMQPA